MSRTANQQLKLFPIIFFEAYLTLTVLLFAFGPCDWVVPNYLTLYAFLALSHLALWFGYKVGMDQPPKAFTGRLKIRRLILWSLILNLFWLFPKYMLRMGVRDLNWADLVEAISTGLTDPGAMYQRKINAMLLTGGLGSNAETTSMIGYLDILLSPILWVLLPLGLVHWNRLTLTVRVCLIFWIVADLLSWVAIGTNKGIVDFALLLPWMLLVRNPSMLQRIKWKQLGTVGAPALVVCCFSLLFFSTAIAGRFKGNEIPLDFKGVNVDRDHLLLRFLPRSAQEGGAALMYYVTAGYYGLSLALEEPFVFSYGIGNSYFLTGLFQRFVGPGTISDLTYPARIEKYGWDRFQQWHSFYTWIASDVSFPGAIIIVFFIGRLLGLIWSDLLMRQNPFAPVLFALLVLMLFYFPANNQILTFYSTAMPFWITLALWSATRRKRSPRIRWALTRAKVRYA